jgi:hypothetical protein
MEVGAFGAPAQSWLLLACEFDLHAVLDLRDPGIRAALQISATDLNQNHRSVNALGRRTPTQELGETCAALRCIDGIVFESLADPPNPNIAIVVVPLSALGSYVKVDQPTADRLP